MTGRGVACHLAALAAALCGLVTSAAAADPEPINVHFHVRPPYMLPLPDGSPGGVTGSIAKSVFIAAGLPVRWMETPAARQLKLIEANAGRECGIGWFRNAQREQFAQFTSPIYRDLPWAIIVRPHLDIAAGTTLSQLMQGRDRKLLVKDLYSYGPELDARIAQFTGEKVTSSGDWAQILGLLKLGRADFMFASQEEGQHLLATSGAAAEGLHLVALADAPMGEYRYLMCSRQVTEPELAALNKAIAALRRPR